MKILDADNFSNEFNSKIFNKLQNEYLNSTADDKTKNVADFVVTDIMTAFNDLIDNAPTVEPDISETYGVAYEQGFRHGKEKYERPQGEWIDCGAYYKCPFCGNFVLPVDGKPKFCDECGAELRGTEE